MSTVDTTPDAVRRAWDRQFKFSEILPDFADWQAWMANRSRAVEQLGSITSMPYGPHERQWLEIIASEGAQTPTVPVFFHGGYWRALRAQDHRLVHTGLSSLGRPCANIEYRLMPECRLEELVADAVSATQKLIDTLPAETKLLLIGHSAGAHLAASAALKGQFGTRLAGVVAVSGIYDLQPVAQSFLQDEIGLTATEIETHSLVGAEFEQPVLCVVGGEETEEFKRQARAYGRSRNVELLTVSGAHHMSILADLHSPTTPLIEAIGQWAQGGSFPSEVDTTSS